MTERFSLASLLKNINKIKIFLCNVILPHFICSKLHDSIMFASGIVVGAVDN